jgi:hypothetical protein
VKNIYLFCILVFSASFLSAQLSLTGTTATIDFTGFDGSGFNNPATGGQLSSEIWELTGASDPYIYAGTNTAGDNARGITDGTGVGTGGVYAYQTPTDTAIWFQPGAADFTPGSLDLYVLNNTGATIADLNVAYNILDLNDQDRANSLHFAYSPISSGTVFTNVPALDFTTVAVQDGSLSTTARSTTIVGINIPNGTVFRLRWIIDDAGGAGARDELGLDDIVLTIPTTASPTVGFDLDRSVYTGEGNAGSGTINIPITMNFAPTGADVVIEVDTSFSHTADYGTDFTFAGPQTLTFPQTGTYPLTQNVTVTVFGDTEIEAPEFLELDITINSGVAGLGNDRHRLGIEDDETPEGLVINEFSQGPLGSQEYLELLVVGTPGTTVDLRNWILDDNSGLFSYGTGTQLGIADGHLRFSDDCNWAQVPVGALILLYADDPSGTPSVNAEVTTAFSTDDPTDANGDYVYVLGLDYGFGGACGSGPASIYLETDCNLPAIVGGYDSFSPASYLPPAYFSMQPRNAGDAQQVRKPDGTYFFGISFGDKGGGSGCPTCDFSTEHHPEYAFYGSDALYFPFVGPTLRVYTFENSVDNDYRSLGNWSATDVADGTTQTPGSPNNAANATFINNLRQPFAVVDVDANITCDLGPNQERFFLANSPEDEIILWLKNNTTTDHQSLTASTIYHGSDFQNTNLTGAPFFMNKQFRATPTITTPGDNFDVRLYVAGTELTTFAAYLSSQLGQTFTTGDVLSNLLLYKFAGNVDLPSTSTGTGVDIFNAPTITAIGSDYQVEADFSSGFSSFGLAVLPSALPVEGLTFQAEVMAGQNVLLSWQTRIELNNDYFEVMHSRDGQEFATLGRIKGAGTSQQAQSYQFWDRDADLGMNHYQLKQVDLDGTISLSNVLTVVLEPGKGGALQSVYPNPATKQLFFSLLAEQAQSARVKLYSLDGRLLEQQEWNLAEGRQEFYLPVAHLSPGLYLYHLQTGGETFIGKWHKE